jgi:hypothetical protein
MGYLIQDMVKVLVHSQRITYFDIQVSAGTVCKTEITAVGIRRAHHLAPSIRKSWH